MGNLSIRAPKKLTPRAAKRAENRRKEENLTQIRTQNGSKVLSMKEQRLAFVEK